MTYQTSPLDKLAKTITIIISLLFIAIFLFQTFQISQIGIITYVLVNILLAAIYFVTFLFRPTYYELADNFFIIHRPIFSVKIHHSQIVAVKAIKQDDISKSIRLFGVGGLFGYFGIFANFELGKMTWYLTCRDKLLLIHTKDKKIIISPDNPEQLNVDFENWIKANA